MHLSAHDPRSAQESGWEHVKRKMHPCSLMACLISTITLGCQNVKGRRGRVSLILSEKIKSRVVWGECLLKVMLFCRMNLKWNWNLLKHSPLSSFNSFWVRRQVLMEHKVPPQTQSNSSLIFSLTPTPSMRNFATSHQIMSNIISKCLIDILLPCLIIVNFGTPPHYLGL